MERIFVHGATYHTAEATLDVLGPVFEDRIISRRAVVVWPPRSCDLSPLNYYLGAAVRHKCYADKPETIEAKYSCTQSTMCLKIGLIVHGMNEIIFHY